MHIAARHQATQLAILNSILAAINSTLNLDQVLNIIVTSVGQVMGNQQAAIYLLEDSGQFVTLAAAHNLSPDYLAQSRSLPLNGHERTVVIATQEALIVDDIQSDPCYRRPTISDNKLVNRCLSLAPPFLGQARKVAGRSSEA